MDISLGIITYKDKNLGKLLISLKNQHLKETRIKEIIFICSKKDRKHINRLVQKQKISKTIILVEDKRRGKYSAVNLFLKKAKSKILVECSGDIILHENAIEELCMPFKDKKTGIIASNPIPQNLDIKKPLDYTIGLLWELHHNISLITPKFGELIAFRNLKFKLPKTTVDEEMIAHIIYSKGYKGVYAEKSIIYNKGPKIVRDYIKQRRRIYCGHLQLRKTHNYIVQTLNNTNIFSLVLKKELFTNRKMFMSIYAVILEGISRLLGYLDFLFSKEYSIWEIIDK
ncbi:MAG: glycosyltransferase [Nanoarchaeota archaeon]